MPVVDATDDNLAGYGRLVDDSKDVRVEIVRWPARGWRPVDDDSGDEGGTTQGVFVSEWQGDVLYGLYIHPDIWHEGVFARRGTQRFFDSQGAVHARVSIDFPREFGCLLEAVLED